MILISITFLSCRANQFVYKEHRVEPSIVNVDEKQLNKALQYLESKCFDDGIEQVLVIRDNRIIYQGSEVDVSHNIWSCSKSFTSTVAGLMLHEKRIALDDVVSDYDPSLREKYSKVTFRHFLTMTSGYSGKGRSRWNDENADWSWTPYDPDDPHFLPGSQFEYWDEAQMQLGRLLTLVLGRSMKEYLDEWVMGHMDFGDWEWHEEKDIGGIPINNGCTNVHVNARQLAKMGILFLNRGKWDGKQLVPKQWCVAATEVQVPSSIPVYPGDRANLKGSGSYGFNWWVNSHDGLSKMPDTALNAAYMSGFNHNVCFIIPEWNMVVVRMGTDGNPPEGKHVVWNEFFKILGKGIE